MQHWIIESRGLINDIYFYRERNATEALILLVKEVLALRCVAYQKAPEQYDAFSDLISDLTRQCLCKKGRLTNEMKMLYTQAATAPSAKNEIA